MRKEKVSFSFFAPPPKKKKNFSIFFFSRPPLTEREKPNKIKTDGARPSPPSTASSPGACGSSTAASGASPARPRASAWSSSLAASTARRRASLPRRSGRRPPRPRGCSGRAARAEEGDETGGSDRMPLPLAPPRLLRRRRRRRQAAPRLSRLWGSPPGRRCRTGKRRSLPSGGRCARSGAG